MNLEHKCLPFELKAATGDGSNFEGIASAFFNIDSAGEIVDDAAFDTSLDAFLKDGFIGGLNHSWDQPIGKPTSAVKQGRGLFCSAQISDTAHGRDVKTLLKDGVIRKLSIGYQVKSSRMLKDAAAVQDYWQGKGYSPSLEDVERSEKGARLLTSLHLFEFSPVSVPANMMADITSVKHQLPAEAAERMAATIQTATLEEMKAKSQYLGDYIEPSMTMAAVSRLYDALFYNVVACAIMDDSETPLEERIADLPAAFDECRDITMSVIRALMGSEEASDGTATALASEMKSLWRDPSLLTGEGEAPAAKSFADESDMALAASAGLISRAKALRALRAKEGRVLSTAIRTRLATLKDALSESLTDIDALLSETETGKAKADPASVILPDGASLFNEFLSIQARANGVTV